MGLKEVGLLNGTKLNTSPTGQTVTPPSEVCMRGTSVTVKIGVMLAGLLLPFCINSDLLVKQITLEPC